MGAPILGISPQWDRTPDGDLGPWTLDLGWLTFAGVSHSIRVVERVALHGVACVHVRVVPGVGNCSLFGPPTSCGSVRCDGHGQLPTPPPCLHRSSRVDTRVRVSWGHTLQGISASCSDSMRSCPSVSKMAVALSIPSPHEPVRVLVSRVCADTYYCPSDLFYSSRRGWNGSLLWFQSAFSRWLGTSNIFPVLRLYL